MVSCAWPSIADFSLPVARPQSVDRLHVAWPQEGDGAGDCLSIVDQKHGLGIEVQLFGERRLFDGPGAVHVLALGQGLSRAVWLRSAKAVKENV